VNFPSFHSAFPLHVRKQSEQGSIRTLDVIYHDPVGKGKNMCFTIDQVEEPEEALEQQQSKRLLQIELH
jgi:glutamine synthetase